jgi:hypothetical protein
MHIQTRLDPQILEAAKRAAELEGTSLSEYLRKLVQQDVETRHEGNDGVEGGGVSDGESDGGSDRIR